MPDFAANCNPDRYASGTSPAPCRGTCPPGPLLFGTENRGGSGRVSLPAGRGREPACVAKASPELIALLAIQRATPPSTYQLRMLDLAMREAARASGRRDRRQRALERYDPTAAAGNARRLAALQRDYEAGRRCDRPRDVEDRS